MTGTFFRKFALLAATLLAAFVVLELSLLATDRFLPLERRFQIPPAWKRVPLNNQDYRWHGHVHRFNSEGFRGPEWAPKRKDMLRIAVLGDSLTYGFGVAEEEAYPARIEAALRRRYRVEVINLGRSGAQSEDVAYLAHRFLPQLKPDLVLYGICLNDYLRSGEGQYLRYAWLKFNANVQPRSRALDFLRRSSIQLLMRLGVLSDFVNDALRNASSNGDRFSRDLSAINRFVVRNGLPPVVAMVVSQIPDRPEALELTAHTQERAVSSGMWVVPATYLEAWHGRKPLFVSRWEGHPNAEAHQAFADTFVAGLMGSPELKRMFERFRLTK